MVRTLEIDIENALAFARHEYSQSSGCSYHVSVIDGDHKTSSIFVAVLEKGNYRILNSRQEVTALCVLHDVNLRGPHRAVAKYRPEIDYAILSTAEYFTVRSRDS